MNVIRGDNIPERYPSEEGAPSVEEAREMWTTLKKGLELAPLLDIDFETDPDDPLHIVVTPDTLEQFPPNLIEKYKRLSEPQVPPRFSQFEGILPDELKGAYSDSRVRVLPKRQIDDQFNPYRKNKITLIIDPCESIGRYMENEDLVMAAKELQVRFKADFLKDRKPVTKEFAREVYELGRKVAELCDQDPQLNNQN